jgi:hypothetical protein
MIGDNCVPLSFLPQFVIVLLRHIDKVLYNFLLAPTTFILSVEDLLYWIIFPLPVLYFVLFINGVASALFLAGGGFVRVGLS